MLYIRETDQHHSLSQQKGQALVQTTPVLRTAGTWPSPVPTTNTVPPRPRVCVPASVITTTSCVLHANFTNQIHFNVFQLPTHSAVPPPPHP